MMSTSLPRRIEKLIVNIDISGNGWNETQANLVIAAGKACPVAITLGDNIEVDLTIHT